MACKRNGDSVDNESHTPRFTKSRVHTINDADKRFSLFVSMRDPYC